MNAKRDRFRQVSNAPANPGRLSGDFSLSPAPQHWFVNVLLSDGGTAHVRPVLPSDGEQIQQFYSRVSETSKFSRFFSAHPELAKGEIESLTHVDYSQTLGLVVVLAEQIIALGHYIDVGKGKAEVSFLVEDAHQSRGIAGVLLEHLARAARERGFVRFVADALPGNQRMAAALTEAGYRVLRSLTNGVAHFELTLAPSGKTTEIVSRREKLADHASVARFVTPHAVAVVGASPQETNVGRVVLRHLMQAEFQGRLYVVNPTITALAGLASYPRVSDIPEPVDLVIIVVPSDLVEQVMMDCGAKGAHGVIVISSGFADAGEAGRQRQVQLAALAHGYGLRLLGPNSLGIINTEPEVRLNASLCPVIPQPGRIAFFCQSGALGVAILQQIVARGVGISTFVNAGNRADLSGNDFLQYWENHARTEVVLLYLESIGNPSKFFRIARRISVTKPIVAVRSGRATQEVPLGHAVRPLAGPAREVDSRFSQAGVVLVESLEQLLDVGQLLAHQPLPAGPRVALISNSDALDLLATDAALGTGLDVTHEAALGPSAGQEEFSKAIAEAHARTDVDALVVIYVPSVNARGFEVAQALTQTVQAMTKPVVSTFLATVGLPEVLRSSAVGSETALRGSLPSYSSVESAMTALAHVTRYSEWLRRHSTQPTYEESSAAPFARHLLAEILRTSPEGRELTHEEATLLLDCYGITLCPQGPPGPSVDNLGDALGPHSAGVPLSILARDGGRFGLTVEFGLAGVAGELFGDRSFRLPPLTTRDAADMISELQIAPALLGYWGQPPVDLISLERTIVTVGSLLYDLPHLHRLELSPVLAAPEGTLVLAASIVVGAQASPRAQEVVRSLDNP
jgi:acyl-CoA synthetase (NDP forming)/GNAT superfamily N-acetyltransferase